MKVSSIVGIAVLALQPTAGLAERIFAVNEAGNLIRFDSATPGVIESSVPLSGLGESEYVGGLDFRPATGELYALAPELQSIGPPPGGYICHLYSVALATGVATQVTLGTVFPTGLQSGEGFDFNPVDGEIRIVESGGVNVRMDPATAEVTADTSLSPEISAVGLAFDHDVAGATSSTAYALDSQAHDLVRIGGIDGVPPPSGGEVTVIGPLGVSFSYFASFDISPSGIAYAVLSPPSPTEGVPEPSALYTVNLGTGAASLLGTVGPPPGLRIVAMAVAPEGGGQGAIEIPTLERWGLFFLTACLCAAGMLRLRRLAPARR